MEKVNTKRRVQLSKSNASPLLKPKRPMLHDPSTSQVRPDKQVRITLDDDESNDDDGDIQGDGETKKLQTYSHRRQEQSSRSPDRSWSSALGSSSQARPGLTSPTQQKMSYSPPSRTASKPSESPSKKSVGSLPAVSKAQPERAPSPTASSATMSPAMQSQPQSLGISVANNQPAPSAVPQASSGGESSGAPGSEVSNPINLSLPPRPPIQSATTESAATSPSSSTATTTITPTSAPTSAEQNKTPPANQANQTTPASGAKLNSTPYKASTPSQCMMGIAQWALQCAQFMEQDNKARAEREIRLEFEIAAMSKRGLETVQVQDELRERLDAQSKIIEAQAKELQLFKAESERYVSQGKEIDELKHSGSEQLTALTKQMESLKEDTQKVMKFQEIFLQIEDWKMGDMLRMAAMNRIGQESTRQSFSAGETV